MDGDNSKIVIAGLIVKDAQAFKELVLPIVKLTKAEAGCKRYDVFQSLENPNEFAFIEEYTDASDFAAHRAMPYMDGFRLERAKLVERYLGVEELQRVARR